MRGHNITQNTRRKFGIARDRFRSLSLGMTVFLLALSLSGSYVGQVFADDSGEDGTEKKQEELKDDIDNIEDKIEDHQEVKKNLQKNLNTLQTSINKTVNQITQTEQFIGQTQENIDRKVDEINRLNERLEAQRVVLATLVENLYFNSNLSEMFLFSETTREYGATLNEDALVEFRESLDKVMDDIKDTKNEVDKEKVSLEESKKEKEGLLAVQESQRQQLVAQKASTQKEIVKKEATIGELEGRLSKLKLELQDLLGDSYDTDDIMEAAKFASKKTGVRKDYLLGVLVVESNLGRYTGGCNYKESRMSSYRLDIFKQIAKDLDYNYKKLKVSCPPASYQGTGGAMGVGQFMPDTWLGYKDSIASKTGHNPPDPWNLTDGVMAMALKLAKVDGVTSHKKSGEAKAYCVYLAGNNWAAYCDDNGTNYGDLVLYWADNYEKKL